MDEHWSEVRDDDSAFQRACADADLRDWEAEQKTDRLRRDDPVRTARRARPGGRSAALTSRELEVLREVAAGKTSTEIAAGSHHSPETIKKQVKSVRCRLGARNSAHAVARAFEEGILP